MNVNILDTFRCTDQQILLKDLHVRRVVNAFGFYNILVNPKKITDLYSKIEQDTLGDCRVRVEFTMKSDFETTMTTTEFRKNATPMLLVPATYGEQPSGIGANAHKTTNRFYWDQNRKLVKTFVQSEAFGKTDNDVDVLGFNDKGHVTEASRYNLFLFDGQSLFTPTLESGCMRGVFREHSFASGGIKIDGKMFPLIEKDFLFKDLNSFQLFVANSVQGFLPATLTLN